MFRHKNTNEQKPVEDKQVENKELPVIESSSVLEKKTNSKTDMEVVKELLEKNLKWSQIIYEQNRKINNKLLWASIASWLRVLIIVVPLILAVWFLPPIIQNFINSYSGLLGGKPPVNVIDKNTMDQLLKTLPIDPAKQEQLKALLK